MSKKKKASPAKAVKKNPVKKAVNKSAKPSAKNKARKPAKKTAKPTPKKVLVKPVKKVLAKSVKKVVKQAKVSRKVSVTKAAPKKNTTVKKTVTKAVIKKVVTKPIKKVAKTKKEVKVKVVSATKQKTEVKAVAKPIAVVEKVKKQEEQPTVTKKQIAEKKAQEVLAITNTIPVKAKSEISASKIASISNSITNPIKRPDSYSVKPEKEPAGKFELEFVVHASADMLYGYISTPSGLSEWFCDDLNIRNGIYTFIWEEQMQQARLLKTVELQLVRFQWVDKTDGSYFEFRIQRDDLTNDISLIVTDFGETHAERESSKLLWHSQIEKLMHVIGSIF